jgi:hypothetical protein
VPAFAREGLREERKSPERAAPKMSRLLAARSGGGMRLSGWVRWQRERGRNSSRRWTSSHATAGGGRTVCGLRIPEQVSLSVDQLPQGRWCDRCEKTIRGDRKLYRKIALPQDAPHIGAQPGKAFSGMVDEEMVARMNAQPQAPVGGWPWWMNGVNLARVWRFMEERGDAMPHPADFMEHPDSFDDVWVEVNQ